MLVWPHGVRVEVPDLIDLALIVDRIARPGLAEDFDDLGRTPVAQFAGCFLAGLVGRDDVECQPAFHHMIDGGDGTRQHRRMHLAAADRRQHVDVLGQRRHRRHEAPRVLPHLIGGRTQNVAETEPIGRPDDLTCVFERRPQASVGHAEIAIIIRTDRREPGNLGRVQIGALDRHPQSSQELPNLVGRQGRFILHVASHSMCINSE